MKKKVKETIDPRLKIIQNLNALYAFLIPVFLIIFNATYPWSCGGATGCMGNNSFGLMFIIFFGFLPLAIGLAASSTKSVAFMIISTIITAAYYSLLLPSIDELIFSIPIILLVGFVIFVLEMIYLFTE
jgi:hypothetical protein